MRAIDNNPYFSKGFINKFLNKVFPFKFWGNLLLGIVFSILIMQAPIYLANYLELKKFGLEAVGKMWAMNDYSGYAQSLFAIPIYIAVRELVAKSFNSVINNFNDTVVENESLKILKKRSESIIKIFTSKWLEIALLVLCFAIPIATYISEWQGAIQCWYLFEVNGARFMTFAGIYAWFFTIPVYMFLTFYWIRQIIFWGVVLFVFSRAKIKYNAYIPDGYCGIGFLQDSIRSFSLLVFAQGVIQIATILYKVNEQSLPLYSFNVVVLVVSYIILAPALFIIPMTFFTRKIKEEKDSKIDTLTENSRLVMNSDKDENEKITIYNETITTIDSISKIKVMPVDFQSILRLFLSAFVPMLPIIVQFAGLNVPQWIVDLLGNI